VNTTDRKVGDLCVTINSKYPLLNEGALVVVIAVNPAMKFYRGEFAPFCIRRVDGQVFKATSCNTTGKSNWGTLKEIWAALHHLRRVDDAAPARSIEHDVTVVLS